MGRGRLGGREVTPPSLHPHLPPTVDGRDCDTSRGGRQVGAVLRRGPNAWIPPGNEPLIHTDPRLLAPGGARIAGRSRRYTAEYDILVWFCICPLPPPYPITLSFLVLSILSFSSCLRVGWGGGGGGGLEAAPAPSPYASPDSRDASTAGARF